MRYPQLYSPFDPWWVPTLYFLFPGMIWVAVSYLSGLQLVQHPVLDWLSISFYQFLQNALLIYPLLYISFEFPFSYSWFLALLTFNCFQFFTIIYHRFFYRFRPSYWLLLALACTMCANIVTLNDIPMFIYFFFGSFNCLKLVSDSSLKALFASI